MKHRISLSRSSLTFTGVALVALSVSAQGAGLIASDGAAGDIFGFSVALSGNIGVVGALQDDDILRGIDSGSAYVFRGVDTATGTAVTESAKLAASDGASGDRFAYPVGISGNTGLVGAYLDDDKGAESGSVYVFRGLDTAAGNAVTQSAKLVASDGVTGDNFGLSVSLSGSTGLVGATQVDDNGIDSGAAYLFRNLPLPQNLWVETGI